MTLKEFEPNKLYLTAGTRPKYYFVTSVAEDSINYIALIHQMGNIWLFYKGHYTSYIFGTTTISMAHKATSEQNRQFIASLFSITIMVGKNDDVV